MAPVSVVCDSSGGCRLWLQWLLLLLLWLQYLLAPVFVVAPVALVSSIYCRHGSGISCCSSWLQYLLLLSFVAPVSSVVSSSCGSSISCCMAPVSVVRGSAIGCRLWLQAPAVALVVVVAPVAPVSSICRLWLQAVAHGSSICQSLVAPVSVVHGSGSICCRLWLQSPVSVVRLWLLQYLSRVAPPASLQNLLTFAAPVSSICRSLVAPVSGQYLLSFTAPVSPVVHGSSFGFVVRVSSISCRHGSSGSRLSLMAPVLSNVTSCGSKLSLVAPVAAMVVFLPVALTGNHLVFW